MQLKVSVLFSVICLQGVMLPYPLQSETLALERMEATQRMPAIPCSDDTSLLLQKGPPSAPNLAHSQHWRNNICIHSSGLCCENPGFQFLLAKDCQGIAGNPDLEYLKY